VRPHFDIAAFLQALEERNDDTGGGCAEITQTFFDATSLFAPRGTGGPSAKIKISKIAKSKSKKIKNSDLKFVFHEIDLEIIARSLSCFEDELQHFRRFVSSVLRFLSFNAQRARHIFNGSNRCPYETPTFYLAGTAW
jgi:hypothetical protein